ncbi:hypothetical protein CEXT_379561 [Caerostris extrusa]|uniref:Uncharacterized protein n=1 Tax=Caerostris extrusa TaxID=172846 RepID=A0AAV4VH79_CAEEX|nr:hypothetical protein CEXT_379561 [Caerostris extrusa]
MPEKALLWNVSSSSRFYKDTQIGRKKLYPYPPLFKESSEVFVCDDVEPIQSRMFLIPCYRQLAIFGTKGRQETDERVGKNKG